MKSRNILKGDLDLFLSSQSQLDVHDDDDEEGFIKKIISRRHSGGKNLNERSCRSIPGSSVDSENIMILSASRTGRKTS